MTMNLSEADSFSHIHGLPFLTFRMGSELYALPISAVREVVKHLAITRIPRAPDYMPGMINLRGGVITVIDLGMRFGLGAVANPPEAFIIVVEIKFEDALCPIGVQVDLVEEVIELDPSVIEAPPHIGSFMASELMAGISRRGNEFISILDIKRAFNLSELQNNQELAAEGIEPGQYE